MQATGNDQFRAGQAHFFAIGIGGADGIKSVFETDGRDLGVDRKCCAIVFRLTQQGDHQLMTIDNAG